ncbi:MAG TPA: hypothetical protein VF899_09660 [Pyrinomonadaceae bacterium]
MLSRVVTFYVGCAVLLIACERAPESKLVGTWRVASAENDGKIRVDADHTFTGGEWSLTETHQPPVIPDDGEWHIVGSKLVLNFRGEAHNPKQSKLVLTVRDDDHIVLRRPSGLETTLQRLN